MKKFSASSFFSILSGFTLIEIILVMAVSSVLLASGIALINPSFQLNRGNDAKRKSDLLSIRSALEQYNGDNGDYPGSVGWCSQISDASKADVKTSLLSYMQKVPQDPKYAGTTKDYYYWHYEVGQYRLYSVLDNTNDIAASPSIQANDISGSGSGCPSNVAYNYKNDSFAPVGPTSTVTLTPTSTPTPLPPNIQLLANSVFPSGVSTTLSYSVSGATSCSGTNGTATWRAGSFSPTAGSQTSGSLPASDTTFTLDCINANNVHSTGSITTTYLAGTILDTFKSTVDPSTRTAESTAGNKDTLVRTGSTFTLKGVGFYVENGVGNYAWSIFQPSTGTLVASGTTGGLPDSNNYYYGKLSTPLSVSTNTSYLIVRFVFPNASSGTARYTTSSSDLNGSPIAISSSYFYKGTSSTGGAYAIKFIY